MSEYSEGILDHGAVIIKDGVPMSISEVIRELEATERKLAEAESLLSVARCPNRGCKDGVIAHQTGEGDWEPEQCQWCYEKSDYEASKRE